jgi:hypothetical protein
MLGRLFFGIHWILFLAFVGMWSFFLLGIIFEGTDIYVRGFIKMFDGDRGLVGRLLSGAMTWIPPVFFFIDYVVHGKWTWLPWKRNKD